MYEIGGRGVEIETMAAWMRYRTSQNREGVDDVDVGERRGHNKGFEAQGACLWTWGGVAKRFGIN
jgi:hypothetical protein